MKLDSKKMSEAIGRKLKRQTLEQVAVQIGTSKATLCRLSHGKTPDLITYAKLCKYLNVPLSRFLITGSD